MPILPNTYQRVEYIQSSGTQYINTGFIPDNNTTVEISMGGWATSVGNYANLFGARYDWSSTGRGFLLGYNRNKPTYFGMFNRTYDDNYKLSSTIFNFKDGNNHTIKMSQSGIYEDWVQKATLDTVTFTSPVSMYIFCDNDNGTASEFGSFKLYYFKLLNNGTLVRDFVPCYRKSDNVIGLYDLVNNQFYTNSGTGTFTKGADVPTHGKIKKIYMWTDVLPTEYQQVEYIQSTATNPGADNSSGQCIDTLYTHNPNTKISIDIQFTTTAVQQRLFGVSTVSSSYSTFAAYINGSTQWARATKDGEGNWQTTSVSADTNRHTFVLQNSNYVIYTNGATTYSGNNGNTMTKGGSHTLPLLCAWGDGDGKYLCHASAKLYGCKIWDSGILVRDFVPCYRKLDNVIGLYDLINDQFYTNAGTGTFTKGNDVVSGIEHQVRPALPKSFYYDFRNSSLDNIQLDWTITNSSTITYDVNYGVYRNTSTGNSMTYKFPIDISNMTERIKITMGVRTRSSSGSNYGVTTTFGNGTSTIRYHENGSAYCIGDINGMGSSSYPTRSPGYNVDGEDVMEWDFTTNKMKMTVVGNSTGVTYNMAAGQLDTVKTFTTLITGSGSFRMKYLKIERE